MRTFQSKGTMWFSISNKWLSWQYPTQKRDLGKFWINGFTVLSFSDVWKCLRSHKTHMAKRSFNTHTHTHRSYMSSSLCRRWQRAGRCRSCPPWWGPSSCGTGCREGRRTWWRQTHPWSPFYTERQQDRLGKSQLIAGDGGDTPAASQPAIKLTLILWILGPRFSFFAGTSTHTCMPFLSNLFAQLSVDKHCLLKSAKTASSGKILDILKVFLKNKSVSKSDFRAVRVVLVSTCVYLHIYGEVIPDQVMQDFCHSCSHPLPHPHFSRLTSLHFRNTGACRTGELEKRPEGSVMCLKRWPRHF